MKNPDLNINFKYSRYNHFLKNNISETFLFKNKKSNELLNIENKIDEIIYLEDYENLSLFLQNGYLMTEKQENDFLKQLEILFEENRYKTKNNHSPKMSLIMNLFDEEKMPLSKLFYAKLFFSPQFHEYDPLSVFINNEEIFKNDLEKLKKKHQSFSLFNNIFPFNLLLKVYEVKSDQPYLIKYWFNKINTDFIDNNNKVNQYLFGKPFESIKNYLLQHMNKKQQEDLSHNLKYMIDKDKGPYSTNIYNARISIYGLNITYRDIMKQKEIEIINKRLLIQKLEEEKEAKENTIAEPIVKSYTNKDIQVMIKQTREIFLKTSKEKLLVEEQISFKNTDNLPESSQKILLSIESIYKKISPYIEELSIEEQANVNRLVSKRIPEYVNTFVSLDSEYQSSSSNSNGVELLDSSLNNILYMLEQINTNLNEAKINSLKAGVNYTSNYTK